MSDYEKLCAFSYVATIVYGLMITLVMTGFLKKPKRLLLALSSP